MAPIISSSSGSSTMEKSTGIEMPASPLNLGAMATLVMRKLPSDDPDSVMTTLETIADLCKSTNSNLEADKREFVLSGGYGIVILAMERWPADLGVQKQALRALCNVSCSNRLVPSTVGVVETVVATMSRFHDESTIQEFGIVALNNLSRHSAANAERIISIGGVAIVVRAMELYPSRLKLQIWGTRVISRLSACLHLAPKLVEAGALQALASVIQHNAHSAGCKEARLAYLAILKDYDP